ncbi:helix-turn-helix domain-containing protein [Bacillus mangrovi]|uniref:Helix-turn-helix domain-containing protein n=1 Tax=Metabacillus mangrovi TaxID=1491830 RepID=A0A7X2V6A5_9BACI|nr:helix-turn-helix domain-containing protein [Metabacillus mangrovi]MTH54883.1 helix-turn-helix domain-containing protein [Metabacillus mangrovi]
MAADEDKNTKYLSTQYVADEFGVARQKVEDWIENGQYPAVKLEKDGDWKISREAFEFMKKKNAQPNSMHERIMATLREAFPDKPDSELEDYELVLDEDGDDWDE